MLQRSLTLRAHFIPTAESAGRGASRGPIYKVCNIPKDRSLSTDTGCVPPYHVGRHVRLFAR